MGTLNNEEERMNSMLTVLVLAPGEMAKKY
jgi:hypothetical protein